MSKLNKLTITNKKVFAFITIFSRFLINPTRNPKWGCIGNLYNLYIGIDTFPFVMWDWV